MTICTFHGYITAASWLRAVSVASGLFGFRPAVFFSLSLFVAFTVILRGSLLPSTRPACAPWFTMLSFIFNRGGSFLVGVLVSSLVEFLGRDTDIILMFSRGGLYFMNSVCFWSATTPIFSSSLTSLLFRNMRTPTVVKYISSIMYSVAQANMMTKIPDV